MKFAVCYNCSREPCTFGSIKNMDEDFAVVKYSKNAPIWSGDNWDLDYIKVFDTEKECRDIVENYEKTKQYDPR
jgi:hypothetical protein